MQNNWKILLYSWRNDAKAYQFSGHQKARRQILPSQKGKWRRFFKRKWRKQLKEKMNDKINRNRNLIEFQRREFIGLRTLYGNRQLCRPFFQLDTGDSTLSLQIKTFPLWWCISISKLLRHLMDVSDPICYAIVCVLLGRSEARIFL